jgi:oxygen-independent coproporphyrinogen-3 oxidase
MRGMRMNEDDRIRRAVIQQLICHFTLAFADIEQRFGIEFTRYFADELPRLQPMQDDGLLDVDARGIEILPAGRLLIRNICMVFDAYLDRSQQKYSKVI